MTHIILLIFSGVVYYLYMKSQWDVKELKEENRELDGINQVLYAELDRLNSQK